TAKSKTGYIGITGYWLDENFKSYDILIGFEKILYPHTADSIATYLEKYIEDYNIEKKVICIITDNGGNIKAAVNILNENNHNIQRLLCVTHTL
ncbi:13814_t:CDS:1, partial [Funneliformis caledonium]